MIIGVLFLINLYNLVLIYFKNIKAFIVIFMRQNLDKVGNLFFYRLTFNSKNS